MPDFSTLNMRDQAEVLRLLLLMRLANKFQIIAWADSLIETQDQVPNWILDVSLAANRTEDEIELLLRGLPGTFQERAVALGVLEYFAYEFQDNGKFTSREAAKILQVWADNVDLKDDERFAATTPLLISDEIEDFHINATDAQVVDAINACIERFLPNGDSQ